MAQHIAHLFIRDPISVFKERLNLDDENDSDHFEVRTERRKAWRSGPARLTQLWFLASQNLQSTNWQTMRFKPPPPNSDIGWRVEFRPMEVITTGSSETSNPLISSNTSRDLSCRCS